MGEQTNLDGQLSLLDTSDEYAAFVEKFKPKRTTDDCFTPEIVYKAILDYCVKRYRIDPKQVVRPFYPDKDYKRFDYTGAVVVDNPPFSIITEIVRNYTANNIPFFLFSPYLTSFSSHVEGVTHIITESRITYENGALVDTAFLTNMEKGILARSDPELGRIIKAANEENLRNVKAAQPPRYVYPDEVLTASMLGYMAAHGVELTVKEKDAYFVRSLDAQRAKGKAIFGAGYLLNRKAAAEKAAAEKAAAEKAAAEKAAAEKVGAQVWELSEREKTLLERLNAGGK